MISVYGQVKKDKGVRKQSVFTLTIKGKRNMIYKALAFVQEHIPEKWIHAIGVFFTGLTFLDVVGIAWKCVTGSITLLFALLAWRRHQATMEIKNIEKRNALLENEKRQQELGNMIQSNKLKHHDKRH
jgi:hypothetical protein